MDLAFVSNALIGLIQVHGSWMIAVVVALESAGVPLLGETILVAAALLAATSNQIDIAVVVAAAATGAIIGDGIEYTIGRHSSALRPAPVILPKVPLFSRAWNRIICQKLRSAIRKIRSINKSRADFLVSFEQSGRQSDAR
jgi:hypothetical protein